MKLTTSKHGSIWSLWRKWSREVLVPEGDEDKSLTQEELGQGQEDHCWFNNGLPCTTSVFPKDTERDVWFLNQDILREEHKLVYDLKKPI